ncbi:MAG: RNA methyltransferase [Clostridia bacterium]
MPTSEHESLTSVQNPVVKRLRALKERAAREEFGQFLVEGEKLLREALRGGLVPRVLLYDQARALPELIRPFEASGAACYRVTDNVLEAVCSTRTPQGCCCAFALPDLTIDFLDPPARLVALDGVQDPGNVGTIWRTADAAGFDGLLLGEGSADPFSPKVQRAAMGSGFRVRCAQASDLSQTLAQFGRAGYQIVASSLQGEPFYGHAPLGDKYVLVIGSEAHGVSAQVARQATMRLKLPMRGGAESLNAAVAAGIMMYEMTK